MADRAYNIPRAARPRKAAGLLILSVFTVLSGGCLGNGTTDGARPSPRSAPLEAPSTGRVIDAEIPTLAALLPDAFGRLEWAELRLVDEVTALHAVALTPDGREVHIRAQSDAGTGSRIQVRAGHFGDPDLEQRFLDALRRELRKQVSERSNRKR